ncbi:hypothetical protein HPB49_005649 [Dermacentor silvarum]|uniref:Uncharacterized protein n=1 Tax=Dermacentor silvarum TaxID=543639 RepID=A0ACB8CJD1_DERSI|nr:hypothetical protein HPB49_005649 [Dermacentor silvarum]
MTVGSDKGSQVLRPQGDGPPKTTVDALSSTQSSLWSSEEKGDGQEAFDNSDLGGAGTAGMLCCRYGLLVSTMSLLMVAVGYGAPAVVRAYALSCTDPGCLEPNAALERSMADAQGNPCDDFYGFVCGGWQRENPGVASHFQSLQQRVATAAIMSLVLDEGGDGLPSHQVARLFQRCAQVAFNEQNRIDELRAFLDRFNLSWPTPMSRSKLDTLDVMVSLSLDWGVPVFFHLSVDRYFKRPGFRTLHFTGNPYMLEWFMARNALQERGVLLAYFDRVSVLLNGSSASKSVVEEVLQLDNHVLMTMVPSLVDPRPDTDLVYIVMEQLDYITGPYLSTAEWLLVLNKHLPVELGPNDEIFVMNRRLLRLVGLLVGNVEDTTSLLAYVTWHVVRHLASVTSYPLSRAQFADAPGADTITLGYMMGRCYMDADSAMPFAFVHVFNRRWLPADSVRDARGVLNSIRAVANSTMASLSWMDAETKSGALEKLATLRAIVGSLERASGEDSLRSLYPYVPELSGSYLNMALALRSAELRHAKKFLRVNESSMAAASDEVSVPLTLVNAFYLPVYHVMVIPAAILYPPFYVAGYPASYNYGSLGHVVGHEMTHAFDPDLGLYGRDGLRHNWWTPASEEMFLRKLMCLRRLYNEIPWSGGANFGEHALSENFADSGGMLKAYRAYQASAKERGTVPPGLSRFSDEQLFFVSSCFKWCASEEKQNAGRYSPPRLRCNVPLLNMPEFAQAFECGAGKAMNPSTHCDAM